jgi:hypothetical protein
VTLYTTDPPEHDHRLFVAPRPLPGRLVGRHQGMVFDVPPEAQASAERLNGQPITVVTADEYAALVEAAVVAGGYTRADYEEIDLWDPAALGADRGLVLITIAPATA